MAAQKGLDFIKLMRGMFDLPPNIRDITIKASYNSVVEITTSSLACKVDAELSDITTDDDLEVASKKYLVTITQVED